MRREYLLSLIASVTLAGAAFLPWLRLGTIGLPGIPDPAGFFVLGLGVLGVVLSGVGLSTRRDPRQALVLIGLAGLTTLIVVWWTGPATIAERAQARAEAVALVDSVAVQAVPPVSIGPGLILGLAAAVSVAGAGLTGARARM
jgi:hypothetical protein